VVAAGLTVLSSACARASLARTPLGEITTGMTSALPGIIGVGKRHAGIWGICAGGAGQLASLPRPTLGMRPERRIKPGMDGGLTAASVVSPLHHIKDRQNFVQTMGSALYGEPRGLVYGRRPESPITINFPRPLYFLWESAQDKFRRRSNGHLQSDSRIARREVKA
jgi:hypothetical protein